MIKIDKTEKDVEIFLLSITNESPLIRKLMSKVEIKVANRLVKEGKLVKGISDDKQRTICYYAN